MPGEIGVRVADARQVARARPVSELGEQLVVAAPPLALVDLALRVELVANGLVGDEPAEHGLSIQSKARVLTGVMVGLTALNATVALAAPAVGPIATVIGLGSLTAMMLPYSIWLTIVGVALTFAWVYVDLPLGPGAVVDYTLPSQPAPATP